MNKLSKKTLIFLAVIILVILGAVIAYFSGSKKEAAPAQIYQIPERNDYFLGTSTPRLTIVEFSDFACPYCRNSYTTVREIGFKYKNSVKIIFKDFPLHADSLDLAMAGRCAGEQGLFWPLHDKLFSLQGRFATSSLPDLAISIGETALQGK